MKKHLVSFVVASLLLANQSFAVTETFVILNDGRVGDQNQLHGIVKDLKNEIPYANIKTFSNKDIVLISKEIKEKCEKKSKIVFLTSGQEGIKVIDDLGDDLCASAVVVNSAHMIFNEHSKILGKADIIAIAKHAITPEFISKAEAKHTKIVETIGVSHNIDSEAIKTEYKKGLLRSEQEA